MRNVVVDGKHRPLPRIEMILFVQSGGAFVVTSGVRICHNCRQMDHASHVQAGWKCCVNHV